MGHLIMLFSILMHVFPSGEDGKEADGERSRQGGSARVAGKSLKTRLPLERLGSVLGFPPEHDLSAPFYPVLPRTTPYPKTVPGPALGSIAAPQQLPLAGRGSQRRWHAFGSSLALYDDFGVLRNELGLGLWRDEYRGEVVEREMRGGVSGNGRFAWHWQRIVRREAGLRGRTLRADRMLVYLGTAGQILWMSEAADAPPRLPPLLLSADGETALVFERAGRKWSAVARLFVGSDMMRVRGADRIEGAGLTANGRFATVLWIATDGPLLYTFFDLRERRSHRFPAADVLLGKAHITEEGVVKSGPKTVFSFR